MRSTTPIVCSTVLSDAQVVVLRIVCSFSPVLAVSAIIYSTPLLYRRHFGHERATMAPRGFRHLRSLLHKDQRRSGEAVHIGDSEHHGNASQAQLEGKGQNTVRTCQESALAFT